MTQSKCLNEIRLVALGGSTLELYRAIWRGMSRFIAAVRRDLETAPAPQLELPITD